MGFKGKPVLRAFQRSCINFVCFLYSRRDGVQEGMEKLLNCWIYEMIAFFALIGGFVALGVLSDWTTAGFLWIGPLIFSFVLNVFLVFNYLSVIKRSTSEERELYFPEGISNLLKINALIGFFLPYGIYAKGMLFKHFYILYKKDKLPWASPKDTSKERRKKFRQARIAKRRALDRVLDEGLIKSWRASKSKVSSDSPQETT
ncbi:hypothetical protein OVS_01460 [Mycoplasma ovis str. Michigan]|uniref:Uncharacterized protein n=1 Tax=Mycoplasma ovis str. Michigan TaxID=1415773 RepID=A0ABM5P1J6_9MOLU|nr:hypothetical protein [Mycoplasma ovis]AHC40201.1 hypothetical protein OVS_01460 [Mycoplasma ovis str. Michigan]